jgi:hypothetical protein
VGSADAVDYETTWKYEGSRKEGPETEFRLTESVVAVGKGEGEFIIQRACEEGSVEFVTGSAYVYFRNGGALRLTRLESQSKAR